MAKILMPRATAIWLLENTSLTFKQISAFCELHILEVNGIADGEITGKMPGINPITNKILTEQEIKRFSQLSGTPQVTLNEQEITLAPSPSRTSASSTNSIGHTSGHQV